MFNLCGPTRCGKRKELSHRDEGCLVLGFCVVTSCFIFKSNSPLVSGHLPFLMCHRSDRLS